MKDSNKNLYKLDELSDYKVDSNDPDVKGWDVKDSERRVIGKVDNLLVNKQRMKVVYLDVEVDQSIIDADRKAHDNADNQHTHDFTNSEDENHIIIPIGMVRIDEDDEYVYTDKLTHQRFSETNRFKKGAPISSDYERYTVGHYSGGDPSRHRDMNDDDFYSGREFDRSKSRDKKRS